MNSPYFDEVQEPAGKSHLTVNFDTHSNMHPNQRLLGLFFALTPTYPVAEEPNATGRVGQRSIALPASAGTFAGHHAPATEVGPGWLRQATTQKTRGEGKQGARGGGGGGAEKGIVQDQDQKTGPFCGDSPFVWLGFWEEFRIAQSMRLLYHRVLDPCGAKSSGRKMGRGHTPYIRVSWSAAQTQTTCVGTAWKNMLQMAGGNPERCLHPLFAYQGRGVLETKWLPNQCCSRFDVAIDFQLVSGFPGF